jgi:hypothetical protein
VRNILEEHFLIYNSCVVIQLQLYRILSVSLVILRQEIQ